MMKLIGMKRWVKGEIMIPRNSKDRKCIAALERRGGFITNRMAMRKTDENKQPVSSGIYFYTLIAGDERQTKKVVLLK